MGEALDRKRVEQFEYQRNVRLKEASDSLLAQIPPGREKQIQVLSTGNAVPPGTQLLAQLSDDGSRVYFLLAGGTICGSASAEKVAELGAPLESCFFIAQKDEVGVMTMRVCIVDRRALRPSTEDDNGG